MLEADDILVSIPQAARSHHRIIVIFPLEGAFSTPRSRPFTFLYPSTNILLTAAFCIVTYMRQVCTPDPHPYQPSLSKVVSSFPAF